MKTEKWYERRKGGLGGSDAAVVMGLSPWKTAVQLYKEKRGELKTDDIGSKEYVYWGTLLEPVIIKEYERRTNRKVRPQDTSSVCVHPKHPWMLCNPDGFVEGNEAKTILECKNVGLFVFINSEWGDDGTTQIPAYYKCQCQHNMIVTDAMHCDLAALIGGNEMRVYPQPKDKAFCEFMLETEIKFMEGVEKGTPPEPVNLDDFKLLFPKSVEGAAVEATESVADQIRLMRELAERIKIFDGEKDAAEMIVKEYMKTAELLTFDGVPLATWKTGKKGRQFRLKKVGSDDED